MVSSQKIKDAYRKNFEEQLQCSIHSCSYPNIVRSQSPTQNSTSKLSTTIKTTNAPAMWGPPPPGPGVSDNKVELLLAVVSPPSLAWPPTPWRVGKQAHAATASKVQEMQPATLHLADLEAAAIWVPPPPGPTVSNYIIELLLAVVSPPSLTWPPTPWRVQKQAHATKASKVQELPPAALHLADLEATTVWVLSPLMPAVSNNKIELLFAVISPPSLAWPPTPWRIKRQVHATTASKVQELPPATLRLADLEAAAIWVPPLPRPTVLNNKIELLLAVVSLPLLVWPPKPWRIKRQTHTTTASKVQEMTPATLHLADLEATAKRCRTIKWSCCLQWYCRHRWHGLQHLGELESKHRPLQPRRSRSCNQPRCTWQTLKPPPYGFRCRQGLRYQTIK